jgi:8-oxo-dGTP diphosphatase
VLDVVGAVLVQDGRVLACRRSAPAELAGGWEFPGGKVEPGESPSAAVERECREELGIEVHAVTELGRADDGRIDLILWQVNLVDGTPVPLADHDLVAFVGADQLDVLRWLPIDRALLGAVRPLLATEATST